MKIYWKSWRACCLDVKIHWRSWLKEYADNAFEHDVYDNCVLGLLTVFFRDFIIAVSIVTEGESFVKKKVISLLIAGLMVLEPCSLVSASEVSDVEMSGQNVEDDSENVIYKEDISNVETSEESSEESSGSEENMTDDDKENTVDMESEDLEEETPGEEENSVDKEDIVTDSDTETPEDLFNAGEENAFSAEVTAQGTYKKMLAGGTFPGTDTLKWKICGDSKTDKNKELVIYGSGAMPEYKSEDKIPWDSWRGIKKVVIEDGVTSVSPYMVSDTSELNEVQLGKDVRKIGAHAFDGAQKLVQISFPEQLESIGAGAFNMTGIRSVKLPDSVKSIGEAAFAYCNDLTDVVLSAGLTKLPARLFYLSSEITRMVIPANIKTIGKDAVLDVGGNRYGKTVIQYTGTEEQWKTLNFSVDAENRKYITIVYNFDRKNLDEHVWTDKKFLDNEDTYDCTKGGTESYKCLICGASQDPSTIAPKKHNSYTYTEQEASINRPEIKITACWDCNYKKKTVGKKLSPYAKVSKTAIIVNPQQKIKSVYVKYAYGDSVVSWKSSNTKVATVTKQSNGKCVVVAGKTPGKATLTVTLKSNKKAYVTVTVRSVKTTKITGVKSSLVLRVKKTATLKPVLTPRISTEKITYKSSNTKVATVTSAGKITAKKKGTAYIYVKSGSKTVKCKVVVK